MARFARRELAEETPAETREEALEPEPSY
jgi:hypothetical protein